ncbi:MAG: peroxiredoxin, partial [Steroidobacteraceae bacterium]
MKRLLVGAVLMSIVALPAMAALQEGDSAPQFTAQASRAGKTFTFSLKTALRKGPVVVYFYPSAYTGGCDLEAHTFAQDSGKFARAGATIIGVSLDSIQRLNAFSADPKYCAGKFPTASDAGGAISKSYDVAVHQGPAGLKDVRGIDIGHGFADRTTFVIARDGKIVSVISKVSPAEHVAKAL